MKTRPLAALVLISLLAACRSGADSSAYREGLGRLDGYMSRETLAKAASSGSERKKINAAVAKEIGALRDLLEKRAAGPFADDAAFFLAKYETARDNSVGPYESFIVKFPKAELEAWTKENTRNLFSKPEMLFPLWFSAKFNVVSNLSLKGRCEESVKEARVLVDRVEKDGLIKEKNGQKLAAMVYVFSGMCYEKRLKDPAGAMAVYREAEKRLPEGPARDATRKRAETVKGG